MTASKPIPVTILTGYLGAGKTTVLNHLLKAPHGRRLAVIENEFGEVGVDNDLLEHSEEEIIEMNNGCICCTVRRDLAVILERLLREGPRFDHLVIETTGIADPSPVAQTFFLVEELMDAFVVDGVVAVVDARHAPARLEDGTEEVARQIAFADAILVNKIDLATEDERAALRTAIRAINPTAEIKEGERGQVPLEFLLDRQGFNLDRAHELDPSFTRPEAPTPHDHGPATEPAAHHHHDHEHHGDHQHPVHGVTSVSIDIDRELNITMLETWMQVLIGSLGPSLYRYKGVLAVEGAEQRYVFQGLHMLYEGRYGRPWRPWEARRSRFVFIGRDLQPDLLRAGFEACAVG